MFDVHFLVNPHIKLFKTKVSFSIELVASAASGGA